MATTARTRTDVDNLSARDRLWDSLSHSYGKKTEESNKAYDKSRSEADRQLLSRGMQRSSYGVQTLANIDKQKIDAAGRITDDMIADYENRLGDIEKQEQENAWREKEFAENVRQFNAGQELTRSENALNRAFQTSERLGQQAYQSGENALNRAFQTSEREAQQRYGTSEREAQQAYQSYENQLARLFQTSEREASQAYQSGENALAREFQAGENALARAQEQAQFDANMAYNRERAATQDNQWQTAFDYQAGRDQRSDYQWDEQFRVQQEQFASQQEFERQKNTQELAIAYAKALVAAGMEVPNSLLQQAGLDIRNGQVVLAENGSSSGGGGYSGGGGSGSGTGGGNGSGTGSGSGSDSDNSFNFDLNAYGSTMGSGGNLANMIAAGAARAAQERAYQNQWVR